MKNPRPILSIRFKNSSQFNRFKRAAELRRWSVNTFVLAASEALADEILTEPNGDLLEEAYAKLGKAVRAHQAKRQGQREGQEYSSESTT